MKAGARLVALSTRIEDVGQYEMIALVWEFIDSYNRLTTLTRMTSAGTLLFETVFESLGITDLAAGLKKFRCSRRNDKCAGDAVSVDAVVGIFTVDDEPSTSGANLDISKTADPAEKVAAGAEVLYTLKVSNRGPEEALNVVVVDTLPSNSAVVGGLPEQCQEAGSQVTCNLLSIA